jgi:F-type H+-transporting ATPase subunit delta
MGILAQHVPSIEQLKPGLVEIIEESGGSKQFFRTFCSRTLFFWTWDWLTHGCPVSGGFAIVQPNSQLSINAVEGFPIEDFSEEAVKSQLSESQKIASGSGSEQDIAEAKIEVEVSRHVINSGHNLTQPRFSRVCRRQ